MKVNGTLIIHQKWCIIYHLSCHWQHLNSSKWDSWWSCLDNGILQGNSVVTQGTFNGSHCRIRDCHFSLFGWSIKYYTLLDRTIVEVPENTLFINCIAYIVVLTTNRMTVTQRTSIKQTFQGKCTMMHTLLKVPRKYSFSFSSISIGWMRCAKMPVWVPCPHAEIFNPYGKTWLRTHWLVSQRTLWNDADINHFEVSTLWFWMF